jgi:hypothetical protein
MPDTTTNRLIFDHLQAIEATLREFERRFARLDNELLAIEHHLAALIGSHATRGAQITSLAARLDRIERHLDAAQ